MRTATDAVAAVQPSELHHATVTTALFDLALGARQDLEPKYAQRSVQTYVDWARWTLSLNVPMVVHTSAELAERLRPRREALAEHTRWCIHDDLSALPAFEPVRAVLERASGARGVRRPGRPERVEPLYNTLMFQKSAWVRETARLNPFGSRTFFWVDAGYGHGTLSPPPADAWPAPGRVADFDDDRLRVLRLSAPRRILRGDWPEHFARHRTSLGGGAFGGTAVAVRRYADTFDELAARTLDAGLMDDDQAIMELAWSANPDHFALITARRFGVPMRNWFYLVPHLAR